MRITPAQRKQLKKVLEDIEFFNNGFHKFSDGSHVDVVNIKVAENEKKVYYDGIVHQPVDGITKRVDDCWMTFERVARNASSVLEEPHDLDFLNG